MLTRRLLQVYVFLLPLEPGKLFGVDTIWKPYRVVAILIAAVAIIELPRRKLDNYDNSFITIVLTGLGLSCIWIILGALEPGLALKTCVFVVLPFSMYLCIKLSTRTAEDLASLTRAFVAGALIDAGYAAYEVIALGQVARPAGLSGSAPEDLALHCGLATAFVLFPYPGRCRAGWLSVLLRVSAGVVLCFAVVASGTRGAWIGMVISTAALACVMALSRYQRGRLLKVLAATILLIAVALAFNFSYLLKDATGDLANALGDRVAWGSSDVQSGAGRTEIWKQAVDVASDYYFIGGGLSGFMQATNKRTIFHLSRWPGGSGAGAHNLFLEVLVECGPTSLLLLSACLVAVIVVLFRRAAAANRELSSHGILYSLLFVLVCGFFRGLMASPDLWMVLAFATAFAWRGYSFAKVQCLPLQGTGLRDSNAGSVPGCGAFKTYLRELPHARTAANASGR